MLFMVVCYLLMSLGHGQNYDYDIDEELADEPVTVIINKNKVTEITGAGGTTSHFRSLLRLSTIGSIIVGILFILLIIAIIRCLCKEQKKSAMKSTNIPVDTPR